MLLDFVRGVKRLYGKNEITINMHMHLHIREVIYSYGPPASWSLFSFERLNGVIKNISTNHHTIEKTFMSNFNRCVFASDYLKSCYLDSVDEEANEIMLQMVDQVSPNSLYKCNPLFVEEYDRSKSIFDLETFLMYCGYYFCQENEGKYTPCIGHEPLPPATIASISPSKAKPSILDDHLYQHLLQYYKFHYSEGRLIIIYPLLLCWYNIQKKISYFCILLLQGLKKSLFPTSVICSTK